MQHANRNVPGYNRQSANHALKTENSGVLVIVLGHESQVEIVVIWNNNLVCSCFRDGEWTQHSYQEDHLTQVEYVPRVLYDCVGQLPVSVKWVAQAPPQAADHHLLHIALEHLLSQG